MNAIGKEQYLNLLYRFEDGMSLTDLAVEMGRMGFSSLELNDSPVYLVGSFEPGYALDPITNEPLRLVSFAFQTKTRPIQYILIGSPDKGWKASSEDIHDISNFEVFMDFLIGVSESEKYRLSFENTGLTKEKIQWSGKKVVTIPGVDFT